MGTAALDDARASGWMVCEKCREKLKVWTEEERRSRTWVVLTAWTQAKGVVTSSIVADQYKDKDSGLTKAKVDRVTAKQDNNPYKKGECETRNAT